MGYFHWLIRDATDDAPRSSAGIHSGLRSRQAIVLSIDMCVYVDDSFSTFRRYQGLYSWTRSQCYKYARFEWRKCVYVSYTVFLNINKWYSQLETYTLSVALIYVQQHRKIYVLSTYIVQKYDVCEKCLRYIYNIRYYIKRMLESYQLNAHFVLFHFLYFPYTEWKILLQNKRKNANKCG